MSKLIMTKGLPGSGKSTWAVAQVLESMKSQEDCFKWTVRVNKDDIRKLMGLEFSRDRMQEYQVIDKRDDMVSKALAKGQDVIVDDTNFGKKHEPRLRQLAAQHGARFEVNDSFLQVPIDTCIERDSKREGKAKVGPDVIWGMAETHMGLKRPPTCSG